MMKGHCSLCSNNFYVRLDKHQKHKHAKNIESNHDFENMSLSTNSPIKIVLNDTNVMTKKMALTEATEINEDGEKNIKNDDPKSKMVSDHFDEKLECFSPIAEKKYNYSHQYGMKSTKQDLMVSTQLTEVLPTSNAITKKDIKKQRKKKQLRHKFLKRVAPSTYPNFFFFDLNINKHNEFAPLKKRTTVKVDKLSQLLAQFLSKCDLQFWLKHLSNPFTVMTLAQMIQLMNYLHFVQPIGLFTAEKILTKFQKSKKKELESIPEFFNQLDGIIDHHLKPFMLKNSDNIKILLSEYKKYSIS